MSSLWQQAKFPTGRIYTRSYLHQFRFHCTYVCTCVHIKVYDNIHAQTMVPTNIFIHWNVDLLYVRTYVHVCPLIGNIQTSPYTLKGITYSEYLLIRCNSFSKNMVNQRVWRINWIFIGTCTLYWYWEIVAD